jgi:hypothetical protein
MNRLYRNVEGGLILDDVPASELADECDTPLYVTCENVVRENYRRLSSALKRNYDKARILYAAMVNTSAREDVDYDPRHIGFVYDSIQLQLSFSSFDFTY